MRIVVGNPELFPALLDFFERAGFGVTEVSETTVEVDRPEAASAEQERRQV